MMTQRDRERLMGGALGSVAPEVFNEPAERHEDGHRRGQPPLEASWRTDAEERPHQQAQIEASGVDHEPFEDVRVAPQMRAPHRARLIEMSVGLFQSLAALPQQREPAGATDSSTIRIHRVAGHCFRLPVAPASIRFCDVCAASTSLAG